jgi:hypothetical protein
MRTCTKCGERPRAKSHRWCQECKNAWARANRTRHHELSEEQRRRANCRSYLNAYVSRGTVVRPETCSRCAQGGTIEGHHEDYDKPLEVEWLCRPCHLSHHAKT